MKYCSKCGAQVDDDAVVYPKCGCQVGTFKAAVQSGAVAENTTDTPKVIGILSIVFGSLGGWLGLVFALIGFGVDKQKKYTTYYVIGLCLYVAELIICLIVVGALY